MTQSQDWIPEPPRRSWLSRLLAPERNARPVTTAYAVAMLAAAAFVASLTMTWQSANIPRDLNGNSQTRSVITYTSTVTSPDMLGLVYALGMLGLLGLVGAVINRSDLAVRWRMAASGLTIGLLGVVAAIAISLPDVLFNQFGPFGLPDSVNFTVSYEPGLLCAIGAVVLPTVAIWLAARPAIRELQDRDVRGQLGSPVRGQPSGQAGYDVPPVPVRHAMPGPIEVQSARRASAWAAPQSEPLDLTVTPER